VQDAQYASDLAVLRRLRTRLAAEGNRATDPVERQRLRDELDALVAHLYGLSRADFAHILGAFPLVFPNDAAGAAKKAALLAVYDHFGREGIA
jgi:hypothetical protein